MAVIYATLIVKGKKTFNQVPMKLKDQVKEILIDLEVPELAEQPCKGKNGIKIPQTRKPLVSAQKWAYRRFYFMKGKVNTPWTIWKY